MLNKNKVNYCTLSYSVLGGVIGCTRMQNHLLTSPPMWKNREKFRRGVYKKFCNIGTITAICAGVSFTLLGNYRIADIAFQCTKFLSVWSMGQMVIQSIMMLINIKNVLVGQGHERHQPQQIIPEDYMSPTEMYTNQYGRQNIYGVVDELDSFD